VFLDCADSAVFQCNNNSNTNTQKYKSNIMASEWKDGGFLYTVRTHCEKTRWPKCYTYISRKKMSSKVVYKGS